VPLIFDGPGVPAGKRVNGYVYLNDIYPTLCGLTGMHVPASVEGRSLTGAFGKKRFMGRDYVFFSYLNVQRAIVKGSFKLIRYNVNGQSPVQLFNLKNDPLELHNLAEEDQYKGKVISMTSLLDRTMKQLGDFCDLDKPGWGAPQKWTSAQVAKLNP
jgi:arylsulfatase A-like enzyme